MAFLPNPRSEKARRASFGGFVSATIGLKCRREHRRNSAIAEDGRIDGSRALRRALFRVLNQQNTESD